MLTHPRRKKKIIIKQRTNKSGIKLHTCCQNAMRMRQINPGTETQKFLSFSSLFTSRTVPLHTSTVRTTSIKYQNEAPRVYVYVILFTLPILVDWYTCYLTPSLDGWHT